MYYCDDWPRKAGDNEYGDDELNALLRNGDNPFKEQWDVQQLTNEVKQHVNTKVGSIQVIAKGSNNYVSRELDHTWYSVEAKHASRESTSGPQTDKISCVDLREAMSTCPISTGSPSRSR